ncbi:LysR family transcriptional regulator [Cupriavidus metallidurans]|uniref:DNA-binding transcriptional regulator n=1 Tax=Cupriavidus metallidurans (strain ATCC 43123 / DSM 2839 / NBRC 102507 / CH34) TaxID=266264 RepID=Q1LRZ1_CUPMC|nr:LysR family transcriptional regulator [Cupriavidus metallidurans]ABF07085.1 putative DNA-binding transcriptional regulator [Cupriavidus metallidurans CH34]AVA32308.1 LysR family transcriptional regulator [Cupriavidus metallidurans]QGS28564.1 LysR family transcriptional regulator [Cupriavidus metallidurans]UBM11227.1 LysR family transcriptional regulator [Cupriavidus metallidurans]
MDAFSDLAFFVLLVKRGSLAGAAQQLGVTPSATSKRLAALEARLGVRLLNRTTRRLSVTPEGEAYLAQGGRILAELDELEQGLRGSRVAPRGLLRVNGTLGFGRRHLAPAIGDFLVACPDIEVQLQLTDRALNLAEEGYDVGILVGDLPDARLNARRLALNSRLLCASPAYLARHGEPASPRALTQHRCIVIRESEAAYGTWHLQHQQSAARQETVKVRGMAATNDGEVAVNWALQGHGIVLRSEWEVAPLLRSGRLRQVLPEWSAQAADIHAVYLSRDKLSARVRAFVDFLAERFGHYDPAAPYHGW